MNRPKFTLPKEDLTDPVKSSIIPTSSALSFWSQWEAMLPTPEEEMEAMEKRSEELKERIQEISEMLEKMETVLKNDLSEEERSEILEKRESYQVLLESFEADLQTIKVQKKTVSTLYDEEKDDDEANDEFLKQLPTLFATSYISASKKLEDVNAVVDKISRVILPEECIECGLVVKDEKNRKKWVQHFHFIHYPEFSKIRPVLCIDCLTKLYEVDEEIKEIHFTETEDKLPCKRGTKLYSSVIDKKYSLFLQKMKKYDEKEKENFISEVKSLIKTSETSFKL